MLGPHFQHLDEISKRIDRPHSLFKVQLRWAPGSPVQTVSYYGASAKEAYNYYTSLDWRFVSPWVPEVVSVEPDKLEKSPREWLD